MSSPQAPPLATASSKTGRDSFLTIILIIFFVGFTAFFLFVVGTAAWHEFHPWPQGGPAAMTDTKDQVLSVKLDSYSKHADDLEKLTSVLTGLSVLYALALGLGAYLGVQQNLQQANAIGDELNDLRGKARKQLDEAAAKSTEVVNQIRDEFPLFGYVDTNLRRITARFVEILPFKGWSDQIYASLKSHPGRIEEILFYEKTAASLDFFDLGTIRPQVSQIYQGLGNFYALKHLDGKLPEDLNRCHFYLDRATLTNAANYGAWNDRAWVAMVLETPANYATARQYSQASLRINAEQQRGLYNLAISEHEDGRFASVEDLLTRALKLDKWQEAKNVGRMHNLYYNRACALSRLSANPANDPKGRTADEILTLSLDDVTAALDPNQIQYWDTTDRGSLHADFAAGGELEPVAKKFPAEVHKLLARIP